MFVGPYAKATTTKDLNDHFRKYNAKYRLKWYFLQFTSLFLDIINVMVFVFFSGGTTSRPSWSSMRAC